MLKYKSISSHILIHNIMHNDVMLNYGLMEKICLTTVCVCFPYKLYAYFFEKCFVRIAKLGSDRGIAII